MTHAPPVTSLIYIQQCISTTDVKKYVMTDVQVAKRSLILGKWMRSEIVGSSRERPSVNETVGEFSVFLLSRISHSICASQVGVKLRFATCRTLV
jgi:hypothetical protein